MNGPEYQGEMGGETSPDLAMACDEIKSLRAENEALKAKLGVAVGALEKAYDSERETYWHVSEHDLGEHLKDFKLENQKMKDLKEAIQTIQGENKC